MLFHSLLLFILLPHFLLSSSSSRLYREALKQAAVDPSSGKVDIAILTTGLSSGNRKRRTQLKEELWKLIGSKGKVTSLNIRRLHDEMKGQSEAMIPR